MPVGKLNKRSFRPLIDPLQRPVTWPLACGFQLSTFLWHFKLHPSNWKPTLRDIFCNRNEPKQSINTAWQITEVSKQKVSIPKTDQLMYGCHEPYLQMFKHNLALSGSSRLLSWYALPLLRIRLCSTVQLCLSLWPWELDKPPSSRLACCLWQIWTPRYSLKGIWPPPYHISASLMLECWQNLSNWPIRGYTRSWYTRMTFCSVFPQAFSRFLSPRYFFIFSRAVFCTALWLIKHLKEANCTAKTPLRNLATGGLFPEVPPSAGKITVDKAEQAVLIAL